VLVLMVVVRCPLGCPSSALFVPASSSPPKGIPNQKEHPNARLLQPRDPRQARATLQPATVP
jgi:hypothetical protein